MSISTILALLQTVVTLLLSLQGNPAASTIQTSQALSAATQVVAMAQQQISSGATPIVVNPNAANPFSTASNPVGSLISSYQINPTAIDYLGTLVSGGTVSNDPANCNQALMNGQTGYGGGFVNNSMSSGQTANPTVDAACRTIGQNWVGSIDYTGSDGSCYHADWTGTYKMDCATLTKIVTNQPAVLPNGQWPSDATSAFGWSAYDARCYYTQGDTGGNVLYGAPTPTICGANRGIPTTPTQQQILSSQTTQANPFSTASNPVGSLISSYQINPTAIDYLGTLVSGGTVSNDPANCNQALMNGQTGYGGGFVNNSMSSGQTANPTVDAACRTIGQNWVGSIDYTGSDGSCYHADWTGTYKMDCATLTKIVTNQPAVLPNGQWPSDATSAFGWSAYDARCYYTQGDTGGNVLYGAPTPTICGANRGIPTTPTQQQILSSQTTQANPFSTASNPVGSLISSYQINPTAIDYLGTLVSGGTVSNDPANCNQALMNGQTGYGGGFVNNSMSSGQTANPTVDAACRTIGQNWVGSIDYTGSDGSCYHADWTGTYKMDCATLTKIVTNQPAVLPNGQWPSDATSAFGWSAYDARCYYTQGDTGGNVLYGAPTPTICGANRGIPTTPTQQQILSSQTTQANPFSTASNPVGSLISSYQINPTAIDYLGTLVSGGTVSNDPANCNQALMNGQTGYGGGFVNNSMSSGQTANPTVDAACRTIGQNWVGSIDYTGSDGSCYHADWTGTYKMDCATLTKIVTNQPAVLPNGQWPSDATSAFGWSAYDARCYYTQGDTGGNVLYGAPTPTICGANRGIPTTPTQQQIVTPSNPTSTTTSPSSSNACIVNSDCKSSNPYVVGTCNAGACSFSTLSY